MPITAIPRFVRRLTSAHLPPTVGPAIRFDSLSPPFTEADLRYIEHVGIIAVDWPSATFRVTCKGSTAWHKHRIGRHELS